MYGTAYNQAFRDTGLGTGGDYQQVISAATAAMEGLAGGNLGQALSGAAAPYLAEVIHHQTTAKDPDGKEVLNVKANLIAHAAVGAITSWASGNVAIAGAAGAVMGEYTAQQLNTGVEREKLSEEQRQTISALSTLAAGLAGGLTGGNTGSAITGAQSGKNAVENNSLAEIVEQKISGESQENKYQKALEQLKAAEEAYKQEHCTGISQDACSAKKDEQNWDLIKGAAGFGVDFVPVVGDIKSFHEAQTAIDYLAAMVGVIPGVGDVAGKVLKAAQTALKKGDVTEASKLINKASDEVSAPLPMESRYNQMNQPKNPSYQPVRNQPTTISNRDYSGHALDRMQDRGITPTVIENIIKNGKSTPSRNGKTVFFDSKNNISVVTNESGRVITVKYGGK